MRVAISGASGFIGSALVNMLRATGHDVLRLVRAPATESAHSITWDPARGQLDPARLEGIDAFVNVSGESLAERWTEERKKRFRSSRVGSTSLIASTLARLERKPAVLLSTSATGIYGNNRGDEELDERSSLGDDFLARLCRDWEDATAPAGEAGIRVVNTRFGPVLHPDGGALQKLLPIFKLGVGGKVGSGDQWVSWIARTDLINALIFLFGQSHVSGPVNLTSPTPVTNEELAKELGALLNRPAVAPVPAAVVRLMLGREMADETVLASQRVLPHRLVQAGYEFQFRTLTLALRHELGL